MEEPQVIPLNRKLIPLKRKKRKTETTLEFLNNCFNKELLPGFTKLKTETIKNAKLSPKKIVSIRLNKLKDEISRQEKTSQI